MISKGQDICVEGAANSCSACQKPICMRQQVINLALGYVDQMLCLSCLSLELGRDRADIIQSLQPYIDGRPCFKTPWIKYEGVEYCPDPHGCIPNTCFQRKDL